MCMCTYRLIMFQILFNFKCHWLFYQELLSLDNCNNISKLAK